MTMQRRHFELIAATFKEALECYPYADQKPSRVGITKAARLMARELAGTNPNFDVSRFLAACGVED